MKKFLIAVAVVLSLFSVSDSYTGRELCPYDNCSLIVDNIGPGVYYLKCFCCKRVYVVSAQISR